MKYKEILNFATKKITLLYQDFVISVFFITKVHYICHPPVLKIANSNLICLIPFLLFQSFFKEVEEITCNFQVDYRPSIAIIMIEFTLGF